MEGGGGLQIGEVTCGGSPHLSCKRDQIKNKRLYGQAGYLTFLFLYLHVNRPLVIGFAWWYLFKKYIKYGDFWF